MVNDEVLPQNKVDEDLMKLDDIGLANGNKSAEEVVPEYELDEFGIPKDKNVL